MSQPQGTRAVRLKVGNLIANEWREEGEIIEVDARLAKRLVDEQKSAEYAAVPETPAVEKRDAEPTPPVEADEPKADEAPIVEDAPPPAKDGKPARSRVLG